MSKRVERTSAHRIDATGSAPTAGVSRERIEAKAYELHLNRGQPHGHDLDDWLEAERLITLEIEGDAESGSSELVGRTPRTAAVRGRSSDDRETST